VDKNNENLKEISLDLINKAREDLLEKQECREIVKEIVSEFGASQRQILEIINLLALELEDRDRMTAIRTAIKEMKNGAIIIDKAD
jgi:hypothetical protein